VSEVGAMQLQLGHKGTDLKQKSTYIFFLRDKFQGLECVWPWSCLSH